MAEARKLTPKQEAFVLEMLKSPGNAAAAYRRAGYAASSDHVASVCAAQLLAKPVISSAIEEARQERRERALIDADSVVKELALVALSDVGDVLDFSQAEPRLRPANLIPEAARRAISSVKVRRYVEGSGEATRTVEVVEFKLWNKLTALAKLMPHVGLKDDAPLLPPAGETTVNNVNVFPAEAAVRAFLATLAAREVDQPLRLDAVDQQQVPAPQTPPQAGTVPPGR